MYTQENRQTIIARATTEVKLTEKLYAVYRPFYIAKDVMAYPGQIVKCTEIEAMCVNKMRPMTLRKYDWQGKASNSDGDLWAKR